ncbi:septum formation protein Maf [Candidatus Termititenax persephonae]|uniref:dTTP/UTP pyrophosphatase n=1 Tax=Candidatus Termititenax persephonae TaxID=2218525 RepID=A0A388THV1_9BACT|nr:septum formation protein Maf [Candidatus Termititenax persephonae]
MRLVLVSGSARRRELLRGLGLKFKIFVPRLEEKIRPRHYRQDIVRVALAKLDAAPFQEGQVFIACDTSVVCGGQVFGKPQDARQAARFLQILSGQKHTVYSCLALKYWQDQKIIYRHKIVATDVYFREITPAEIAAYVRTAVPYDKAGGYGIQEMRGLFVRKIHGCYYNVVGLPVNDLIDMLRNIKQ